MTVSFRSPKKRAAEKTGWLGATLLIVFFFRFFLVTPLAFGETQSLIVFSGAALQPALEEIARQFQDETGVQVVLDFSNTGKSLAKVRLSGQGDVILGMTADLLRMGENLLAMDSQRLLAYRVPAICVPAEQSDSVITLADLASSGRRIGLGRPDMVLAGRIAAELFDHHHLSEEVHRRTVAFFEDYSRLLAAMKMQAIDAAVTWHETGRAAPAGLAFHPLPPDSVIRIVSFSGFRVKTSTVPPLADRFLEYLSRPQSQKILAAWGYSASITEIRKLAPRAAIDGNIHLSETWK
jgi:molybdate transport system substrate-binding protein